MVKKRDLTQGAVLPQVMRMTVPMIGGMLSMTAFNLIDTWYVSLLGTEPLAAMGFSFPVVMILGAVAMGLGLGMSTVLSQAIGNGQESMVKRLTTHGLLLTVLLVGIISVVGAIAAPSLFRLLGAKGEPLELVLQYMHIWFISAWTVFIPMVANYAIRSTGDTKVPALIMVFATVLNAILDPLFIFGFLGFPKMGIAGASLATALSRAICAFLSIYLLYKRYHMFEISLAGLKEILDSWKRILHISLPVTFTNISKPVAIAFITALVAKYGTKAVAGVSAGDRVQMLLYMFPMAMGSVLIPFCGQNHGAGKRQRIHEAWFKTNVIGFVYGVGCLLFVILLGRHVTSIFSKEVEVINYAYSFLSMVFIGSGFQFAAVHSGFVLNAMGKPVVAALFDLLRSLIFMVGFAYLGEYFWGLQGLFASLAVTNIAGSILVMAYLQRKFTS